MMKSFFKKLAFIMALAMVVSLAAPAAQASAAATQEFTYAYQNGGKVTKLYMDAEETVDLKFVGVKNYADKKSDLTTNWVSYPKSVATVDKNGVVTAVAEGEAIVYLEITDKTGEVTYTSTAVDVVVGKELAPVKLGTSKNDLADIDTVYELTIGDAVDLAFFGVPNYNKTNYTVTWVAVEDVLADEVVEAAAVQVDQKGVVVAVAEGEADVMALIVDNMTGEVLAAEWVNFLVVAAAEPTEEPTVEPTPEVTEAPEVTETPEEPTVEPTEEPTPEVTEAPAISVEVEQKTENDLVLTFTGVDVTKLTKEDIEIYEYFVHEDGETQEYVWQFLEFADADAEAGTIKVVGYNTDELVDGASYVVRYVDVVNEGTADEASITISEDTFVASVGAVEEVVAWYASYKHNNYWWQFYNHAYTNEGAGEKIGVKVFYALYDDNGIDVTGHYEALEGNQEVITLEIADEEAEEVIDWDEEEANVMYFTRIPEDPTVLVNVIYDDFESSTQVTTELRMVVEQAPEYEIVSIDEWYITLNGENHSLGGTNKQKYIALYDDYDQSEDDAPELLNHELVLWFTDNYGNKYVTNDKFAGYHWFTATANGTYFKMEDSEKFTSESYELRYESRNPQVLVVGDDEDEISGSANTGILTTKKTGTASVNVSLYNTYDDELVKRLDVIRVTVKPERRIAKVEATDIDELVVNSKPDNASVPTPEHPLEERYGALKKYDTRFTTKTTYVTVYDQYGEVWGVHNHTLDNEMSIKAVSATSNADDIEGLWLDDGIGKYKYTFDGAELYKQTVVIDDGVEKKTSSVSYKVTVTDDLHDDEETDTFRIALKYPTETFTKDNEYEGIKCKTQLKLAAGDAWYTSSKYFMTTIEVKELSSNNLAVNYADGIELVASEPEYDGLFKAKTTPASKGALYLVVENPKGDIVVEANSSTASGSAIGLKEVESGLYNFYIADDMDGEDCTIFTMAGKYTVKLIEVTSVSNGCVNTYKTVGKTTFTVHDNRMKIDFVNQIAVYVDSDTSYANDGINAIAQNAIKYSDNFERWNNGVDSVAGVRFTKNNRAKQVVINDAFIKVWINVDGDNSFYNDAAYYYVEVPVDKTVTLEDMGFIDNDRTIKNGYDPEGAKMQ